VTDTARDQAAPVPGAIRVAAGLLVLPPVWWLVTAALLTGRLAPGLLGPAALMAIVAIGLLRRARWAWRLAVVFGVLWVVACAVPLAGLVTGGVPPELTRVLLLLAPGPLALLVSALVLLVRPAGRAAFGPRD
jgi:hypothetical protein